MVQQWQQPSLFSERTFNCRRSKTLTAVVSGVVMIGLIFIIKKFPKLKSIVWDCNDNRNGFGPLRTIKGGIELDKDINQLYKDGFTKPVLELEDGHYCSYSSLLYSFHLFRYKI